MKEVEISRIWMVIPTIFIFLMCYKAGWSEEWIQINPAAFKESIEAARSFQEAVFDTDHLYVVTSDRDFRFDDLHMKDSNRTTVLWSSKVYEDPNEWAGKGWDEVMFDGESVRVDSLFSGFDFVYAGVFNDGNCRIYRFSDPNQEQEVVINRNPEDKRKWRVDNGEEFSNRLYVGTYEKGYGVRVLRSDTSYGPIEDELNVAGIQSGDPNIKIGLLKHIGERLFIGTKKTGPGAGLSYTSNGDNWILSGKDTFKDPNDPNVLEKIEAFLSLVEFMGKGWLLTKYRSDNKKQWALWKTEITSEEPQWQKQISSQHPNGPFYDPNIFAVSALQPIGEYLYLACLSSDGGGIWKSYRGINEEWIRVPSPSDPNNHFNNENLLRGVFFNPNDIDHIYAGTKNDKGSQLLTRLVPRMDISNLSMEDRYIGPKKYIISMIIMPNWEDPSYWMDPDHLPSASVFSTKDPNAIKYYFVEPNQTDPSLWEFDPNSFSREGIYNLKWDLAYGKDNEGVVRYLSFAWDSNSPSVPQNLHVGEGDGHLEVQWVPSSDSIKNIAYYEDTNLIQSISRYELELWPEYDPNQITISEIPGDYSGERLDIPDLQNYTIYNIRIRAKDKADNVSGWSAVVEGRPQETLGLLDLLDEKRGCFISSISSRKGKDPKGGIKWLAGLKVGRYKPGADEVDQVYGEDRAWPVQIEIGWIHRPCLDVSFGTGYMELDGSAIKSITLEKSIDPVTFRMIPCSMAFRWIPFRNSRHILTPYLGGGINAWWYQEEKPKVKETDGWIFGYHGLCGVRLLLDQFDPRHAKSIEKEFGVLETYLTLEVAYNWINNLGDSRLDLGGAFYQVGILFLFQ